MVARARRLLPLVLASCVEDAAPALPPAHLTSACVEGPEGTLWRFRALVPDGAVVRVQVEVWKGKDAESFALYPDPSEAQVWSSEWRAASGCPDEATLATFHGWRAGTPLPLGEVEVLAHER